MMKWAMNWGILPSMLILLAAGSAKAGPGGSNEICIGGTDSCSSEQTCDPGKLSDGITAPTGVFSFCYDPDTPSGSNDGTLTFIVENTSDDGGDSCNGGVTQHALIVGSYFNATSDVTSVSLLSATDGNGTDRTGEYNLQFSSPRNIMVDGLGKYSVCITGTFIRSASATQWSNSPIPGPVTFVLDVEGDTSQITTDSFTTVESTSSNGQVMSVAVAKFQSGGCQGDFSAFITDGTCDASSCDPPTIDCPGLTMFDCDGPGGTIVDWDTVIDSDCYDANELTVTCEPFEPGDLVPAGTDVWVTCTVTDPLGQTDECEFRLKVWDFTAPEIFCPNDITAECTSENGAVVIYEVTADDICCPNEITITCTPPSGSTFPPGTTTVMCEAVDWDGRRAECSFDVTVSDNTPPDITCSDDITVACDGASGTVVVYTVNASDACDTTPTVVCVPPSGTTFPIGTTKVTCTATDDDGNSSECCFDVTVTDIPPEITCSDDITVSCDGPAGAVVTFNVTATDDCSTPTVDCVPPSGSTFPVGTTKVTCTATDSSGQTAECCFDVTVTDAPPEITCSDDITVPCDGPAGSVVTFNVTATDDCSTPTVVCVPPSGTTFPAGTTKVTCTATDSNGQTAECCFDVTVTDDPPEITCPADITLECTGPDGTTVNYTVTATDDCGSVTVSCSVASGSTFPCGTTTVDCTATDSAGQTAMCSFDVTINDTTVPEITCPDDIFVEGSDKPVTVVYEVTATDICDTDVAISCDPPSGSIFNPGVTKVICEATDDKGNRAMCMFEVTVQMYVNFDEDLNSPIPDFTFLTDEYEPIGIQLSGVSDTGNPGVLARRTGAPGSTREDLLPTTGLNYAQTWSGANDSDSGKITFGFFDPATGSPTTSSFVQLTFLDIESSGQGPGGEARTRLKAFDVGGNLLDRVIVPFGGNANQFVATIGSPGGPMQIATAEAVIGNPVDSGGVDEFCYLPNLAPITARLLGPEVVYAGETLNIRLFARNNTDENLDVTYKVRGTTRLTKAGRTIDGPLAMTMPVGFDSTLSPETISIPIRGDREIYWGRRAFIVVSYKDNATQNFIGMAVYEFVIQPPRTGS